LDRRFDGNEFLPGEQAMKHPARSANGHKLSDAVLRHLDSYALIAGAAGVGLLALAEPAAAEIVYTPANHVIGNGSVFSVDLNNDGTNDLTIRNVPGRYCTLDTSCFQIESLAVTPSQSNAVVYNVYGAVAMKAGMNIGPKAVFHGGAERMVWSFGNKAIGSWITVQNRYLGVKFAIAGQTHYGWVRLSVLVLANFQVIATVKGYAYETVANQPIVAGKTEGGQIDPVPSRSGGTGSHASLGGTDGPPAMLGMLALGAPGLDLWRRSDVR
jgi:hypothetical protein